jgi:type II secretory pathway component PulJ
VVALAVAALVLVIRWRTLVAASRTRGREAALVALRRRWTTTVTDVVARLQVPSVAVAVAEETGVQR